ncbi:hypothetical protein [Haloarcula argentinensis]|nr:hypothetical protein [Haloarcula argentinensis]
MDFTNSILEYSSAMNRRSLMKQFGGLLITGTVAGCSSDSSSGGTQTEARSSTTPTATEATTPEATQATTESQTPEATPTTTENATPSGDYTGKDSYPWKQLTERQKNTLEYSPHFEGGFLDARGEGTVEIINGVGFGFMSEPAVWVDVGQTVKWVWPDGEEHSLKDENGDRLSHIPRVEGDDTSFTYTLEEEGKLWYSCRTHGRGWKGSYGVIVAGSE